MALPLGQPSVGTDMLAPTGWHTALQMPLLTTTLPGAALRLGQQATGAVAALITWPMQLVVVLRQRAYTVKADVVKAGAVVDQGPFEFVAYSTTVPAPQPVAEIVPGVEGHTLLVMIRLGAPGAVQVPGTVVPTAVVLLRQPLAGSTLAKIVCAGPV